MLLAGDIGGTKTDLAVYSLEAGPRAPLASAEFHSASYPSLESVVNDFLSTVKLPVDRAIFDVAGPVITGRARITNLPWVIDEKTIAKEMKIESAHLINDLEAIARSIPILRPDDMHTLNVGEPALGTTMAVIAPGTGLGESFLTWDGSSYIAHSSEGGHADFAPTDDLQIGLLQYVRKYFDHVSYEHVCSGIGIPYIYDYLRDSGNETESPKIAQKLAAARDRTPVIITSALDPAVPSKLCAATLDTFISILGAEAGNLVLKVLATGGLFLAGGIPIHILPALDDSRFIESFKRKGRFTDLLTRTPVHVVVAKAAMIGVAYYGLELARKDSSPRQRRNSI